MEFLFDHERLDVYRVELEFITWATPLLKEMSHLTDARTREACDHLDRASLSALFNTAEGNGKRRRQVRRKFFDDARGSATECAACLDALVAKQACPGERVSEGKQLLHRIVSMLTRLMPRCTDADMVQEDIAEYGAESEGAEEKASDYDYEDENEDD